MNKTEFDCPTWCPCCDCEEPIGDCGTECGRCLRDISEFPCYDDKEEERFDRMS